MFCCTLFILNFINMQLIQTLLFERIKLGSLLQRILNFVQVVIVRTFLALIVCCDGHCEKLSGIGFLIWLFNSKN